MAQLPSEYNVTLPIARGTKNKQAAKLIQEWLSLHGAAVKPDGAFGPATETAVRAFQTKSGLPSTGTVDTATFNLLIAPLVRAISPVATQVTLGATVVAVAQQHLAEHPREIGGQNSGPWVRYYTRGNEGAAFPWCAAFVTSVLRQAADIFGVKTPVPYTLSCDLLAANAKKTGIFVPNKGAKGAIGEGSIFLNIRKARDWDHTGLVIGTNEDSIETIEGNTNDDGSREGYEVCRRFRSWNGRDFVGV